MVKIINSYLPDQAFLQRSWTPIKMSDFQSRKNSYIVSIKNSQKQKIKAGYQIFLHT